MSAKKGGKGKTTGGGTNTGTRAKKTTATSHAASEAVADAADGRSGRRIPIQLLVDYKAEGSYLFDFCKDLGAGGVFIQTTTPLTTGAAIDLTFTIPDSKETLMTRGTVIWVQSPVEGRKDLTPGMGVQFAAFSEDQRRILEQFVQRYHGAKATTAPVATESASSRSAKRAG